MNYPLDLEYTKNYFNHQIKHVYQPGNKTGHYIFFR